MEVNPGEPFDVTMGIDLWKLLVGGGVLIKFEYNDNLTQQYDGQWVKQDSVFFISARSRTRMETLPYLQTN